MNIFNVILMLYDVVKFGSLVCLQKKTVHDVKNDRVVHRISSYHVVHVILLRMLRRAALRACTFAGRLPENSNGLDRERGKSLDLTMQVS